MAMLFGFLFVFSIARIIYYSVAYKGGIQQLTFMFLLPPLAASANVAAEKMAEITST